MLTIIKSTPAMLLLSNTQRTPLQSKTILCSGAVCYSNRCYISTAAPVSLLGQTALRAANYTSNEGQRCIELEKGEPNIINTKLGNTNLGSYLAGLIEGDKSPYIPAIVCVVHQYHPLAKYWLINAAIFVT